MTLNAVVLPAPFGPMRPEMCPSSTSKETPSRATMPPKRSVTSRTSRRAIALDPKPGSRSLATTLEDLAKQALCHQVLLIETPERPRLITIVRDGPARHAGGGRLQGRAAHVARGESPRGAPGPPRRGRSLRRPRDASVEPRAPRRRLHRPHVAGGVRRRRGSVHAPGDLPRGDGPGRGATARRRDRARHG